MNILDILKPECIRVPLTHSDKKGVIDELVELLATVHTVSDVQMLKDAVWTREQARTTGIGQGLAIPHGKSEACNQLVMALGKPAQPIEYGSIDRLPVRLVVLLASPPDRTGDHIQALARISRLMTINEFRAAVFAAESAETVYRLFEQYETTQSRA